MTSTERHGRSYHEQPDALFNVLFRIKTNEPSESGELVVCEGLETSAFSSQRYSNAKNAAMPWYVHVHEMCMHLYCTFGNIYIIDLNRVMWFIDSTVIMK